MGQARAEPYAAVARDPCADGACGRCATTIAGEVVHACLLPAWRGIRVAVERDSRRIAVGGPVLRRCRWAEAALERGADPRPALELDVGGDAETVADLILPLPG